MRAMTGYVPGAAPDHGLIKLIPAKILSALAARGAALQTWIRPICGAIPSVSVALRRYIADLHRCSIDRVFVGNGSDEILALCTRAFVRTIAHRFL